MKNKKAKQRTKLILKLGEEIGLIVNIEWSYEING